MSLDWDLSQIKDWQNKCWLEDESRDEKRLNPETDILIWGTMKVDLGRINEDNIDDWIRRIEILRVLDKPFGTGYEEGEPYPFYPTREMLINHIGLRTNVGNKTFLQWYKKVCNVLLKNVDLKVAKEKEEYERNREATARA